MNNEEFKAGFSKLVKAFTVQKPEDKSLIYFERLQKISGNSFLKTCDYAVENSDKFPTIMRLIEISRNYPDIKEQSSHECRDCIGQGLISKWSHSFRCRCLNGERMSKQIPLVPVTPEEKKLWYGRLNKEWYEVYGKDLVAGKSYQGDSDPPAAAKAKELFGMA